MIVCAHSAFRLTAAWIRAVRRWFAFAVLSLVAVLLGMPAAQAQSAPTVTGISPSSGPANTGTVVTLTGTGFVPEALSVTHGPAGTGFVCTSASYISSTYLTCTTANSVSSGAHTFMVAAGGLRGPVSSATFTFGQPTVTGITPSSGPANTGTVVTLTGTGFVSGATSVTHGTAGTGFSCSSVSYISSTSLTCTTATTVPSGTHKFIVTAGSLSSPLSSATFTFVTPTAVEVARFEARSENQTAMIEWQSVLEVDNLGYNIYREQNGQKKQLNDSLIAGSALLAGSESRLESGNTYSWIDKAGNLPNPQYYLEAVDMDGGSEWYGPILLEPTSDDSLPLGKGRQSPVLSQIAGSSYPVQPEPIGSSADFPDLDGSVTVLQRGLAASCAVKIQVLREGWFEIAGAELMVGGFGSAINSDLLQLFVDGLELPILITGGEDGSLDSADTVGFYGMGLDTISTNRRAYWLTVGNRPGKRVEKAVSVDEMPRAGSRRAEMNSVRRPSLDSPRSFPHTVSLARTLGYSPAMQNGDRENFYGPAVVSPKPTRLIFDLAHLDPAASGKMRATLQGVTPQQQVVEVSLNGQAIGNAVIEERTGEALLNLPEGILQPTHNVLEFRSLTEGSNVCLLDVLQLTYGHTFTADDEKLIFTAHGGDSIDLGEFTSHRIQVFDVTDPNQPLAVQTIRHFASGAVRYVVTVPGAGIRRLVAVGKGDVPESVSENAPSQLHKSPGAELLMVSAEGLMEAATRLKQAREAEGWSVELVSVEDVYDEFSFGHKSPNAIREFVRFALSFWPAIPSHLLLFGDASWDGKGYLSSEDADAIPTRLVDTHHMETASDQWLADVDGDHLAELAVGRLPARTPEEAHRMVDKVLSFKFEDQERGILLIADDKGDYDFGEAADQVAEAIGKHVPILNFDQSANDPKSQILADLNSGPAIVNYLGHGSVNLWRKNLLNSGSASRLVNSDRLSIYLLMSCLNGYFHSAVMDSLAESLLKADGGAVAVWASSGWTAPTGQTRLNEEWMKAVYGGSGRITLGQAIQQAKAAVEDDEIRDTWVLLGDPSMRLR